MNTKKNIPQKFYNTGETKYVIKQKIRDNSMSVAIYSKKTSKLILSVPRISVSSFSLYREYVDDLNHFYINIKKLTFNQRKKIKQKNENKTQKKADTTIMDDLFYEAENTHFIQKLFKEWKWIISLFTDLDKESAIKFSKYRNEIFSSEISTINLDEISIDATLSDIFWTTTMEGQKETEEEIKALIKTSPQKTKKDFLRKEAKNIEEWFNFISDNNILPITTEKVQTMHKILTKDLDEYNHKSLKYNSWIFRKNAVNLWIFPKKWENKNPPYLPPENPLKILKNLLDFINTENITISHLAIFHIIFYGLHPFQNWNKRVTRLLESALIQYYFDNKHLCVWMWFYFKKNIVTYFKVVSGVLSGKFSITQWVRFYQESFVEMWKISLEQAEIKKLWKISDFLPKARLVYYDNNDDILFRFYKKRKSFSLKEYKKFIKWEIQNIWNIPQFINRKIKKHLKDWIIKQTKKENTFKINIK